MVEPLRILHVDQELGFSGGEAQVVGLVEGLRARGHACFVAGPSSGKLAARGAQLGWEWRAASIRNDADVRAIGRLARIAREERVDLVHLHTGRAAWIGGWAARRARVPTVATRRQDKRLGGWKHRTTYARLASAAVGISPAVSQQLRAVGAEPTTIWSAVDPDRLRPSGSRHALREKFEVPDDTFVIATLASLVERKGLDVLLRATAQLTTALRVLVLIGGEGPEHDSLEALAATLPVGRQARLLGHVPRSADLLGAADAFCLPSRAEGLGVAALEALGMGLPVVASRAGGLGEAVGEAGLLVPPDDAPALAQALDRILGDASLRADLSQRGRARIDAEFLFERQVERYEALYERVARR